MFLTEMVHSPLARAVSFSVYGWARHIQSEHAIGLPLERESQQAGEPVGYHADLFC
jgi:hypothetical protein